MRIDGLTEQQVAIADRLWQFENEEQCIDWVATLSFEMQNEAMTLMELMILAAHDELVDTQEEFPEAERMLRRIGAM